MAKPIKPGEMTAVKKATLPEAVIECWNQIIVDNWNGRMATVKQDAIVTILASRLNISRDAVYKKGYVDIEDIYRAEGWKVKYDKPGYNEDYGAYFEFTKK
jgi:hypothetical protein